MAHAPRVNGLNPIPQGYLTRSLPACCAHKPQAVWDVCMYTCVVFFNIPQLLRGAADLCARVRACAGVAEYKDMYDYHYSKGMESGS